VPMSYDDWLALTDHPRSEWVDGMAILMPPPTPDHFDAGFHITNQLRQALPDLAVYGEIGIRLPRNRVRVPDVAVFTERPSGAVVEEIPLVAIEVVSPSSGYRDTVQKAVEYAASGVGQYWIVDPEARSIEISTNADGQWDLLLHLDDTRPTGEVSIAGQDPIELDLRTVLPG